MTRTYVRNSLTNLWHLNWLRIRRRYAPGMLHQAALRAKGPLAHFVCLIGDPDLCQRPAKTWAKVPSGPQGPLASLQGPLHRVPTFSADTSAKTPPVFR